MKIIEIEFINHIKFKDFKQNWNNSIISIVGLNGSGKSFLLSSLHPYGSSDRYSKAYPVVPGKSGYKKIVYDVNGVIYETIHEYTAHNNTHKCKSYLNKIENGIREELNPTGNVDTFKRLVFEHLKYNSDIFDIGFISFKSNGITGTPTNRRKVLESTVDMTLVDKMKKNVSVISSNQNALVTISKKKQTDLAQYGTIEEIVTKINNNKENIANLESRISDIDENINTIKRSENDLFELDTNILPDISRLVQTLSNVGANDYNSLLERHIKAKSSIDGLTDKYDKYNGIKADIISNNALVIQKDVLVKALNTAKMINDSLESSLLSTVTMLDRYSIDKIVSNLKIIVNILEKIDTVNTKVSDISESIKELEHNVREYTDFIVVYERNLEMSDNKEYKVNFDDNCNTCDLYVQKVKSKNFIENNKNKYESYKNLLNEANRDLKILYQVSPLYDQVINSDLKDLIKDRLVDNILGSNVAYVLNLIEVISDNWNDYNSRNEDIADKEKMIEEVSSGFKSVTHSMEEVESMLNNLSLEIKEYHNILSYNINELNIPDKYKTYNVPELNKLIQDITNIDKRKKEYHLKMEALKNERTNITDSIEIIKRNNTILEIKKEEIEHTSKELIGFMNDKEIIGRCKEIIEKHIPILLLDNNLKFIQDITNEILSENNIPIQVEIIIDNTTIVIPCTVEDTTVPDASMLSAGETCLISLLLNASILHLLGYNILCLDEIDANLDVDRRKQFNNIVVSIMSKLDIDQICCISHNISSTIDSATIVQIGEFSNDFLSTDILYINRR